MRKDLVISCTRHETKVAILEDEQLVEIYFERPDEYSLVGSVHKGRVTRVLPGMQAAFVNIGLERDAFLYVSDFFEPSDEVEPIEIVSAGEATAEAQPAVEPSPVPTATEAREREKEKARRRRRRRRGLPREKYVEAGEESKEFVILPGESLAKYGSAPLEEVSEELVQTQVQPAGPEVAGVMELAEEEQVEEEATSPSPEPAREAAAKQTAAAEVESPEPAAAIEDERGVPPEAEEVVQRLQEIEADIASVERVSKGDALSASVAPERPTGEEQEGQDEQTNIGAELNPGQGASGESLAPATEQAQPAKADMGAPREPGTARWRQEQAETEGGVGLDEARQTARTTEADWTRSTASSQESESGDAGGQEPGPASGAVRADSDADPDEGREDPEGELAIAPPEPPTASEGGRRKPRRRSSVRLRREPNQYMRHPGRPGRARRSQHNAPRKTENPPELRQPQSSGKASVSITDLLREGQELIVQVAKEPIGQKGARITCHVALPGRYVVYMPSIDHLGVSRKIASDEERRRLRRILQSAKNGIPGGFIARTAAEGCTEQQIVNDMKYLYNLWLEIRRKAEKVSAPALLYHDLDVIERVLRDQLTSDFDTIWVDDEQAYERVVRFLEKFQPDMLPRVRLYTRSTPIFDAFNITQELEKALKPKVWLKSGGYIVINQTEALVAIDVNTGKFVGQSDSLEDTIVKTNLEAVKEIVRQIRLRDLGGIIVVDFIDMEERKNRQKVMQALEEAMKVDRAPYNILQFNDFGLVAITRKRVKQSLERALCSPCPYCDGAGYIKSVETVANEILTQARRMAGALQGEHVVLRVHPDVARVLKSKGYREELEEILGRSVLITSDPLLHHEKFDLA